ncbi:MAG TPA: VOC family protein [Gemmatimonadaceae bacterium]|nr:VOC family protein [Gemmatimonadaceae bacterium]
MSFLFANSDRAMRRAISRTVFRRLILILLAGAAGSCSAKHRPTTPVRRIDHIMIRTGHPHEVFAFFTDVLQLPIAWPMDTRAGVTSGGAGFGNVNVEAIQFPDQNAAEAKLVGFAFEPGPLDTVLNELRRRSIRFGAPRPFYSTLQDGTRRNLWTNVTLLELSDADRPANATMHVFLSEYSPAYVNTEQRRVRLRSELATRSGGSLGVQGVKEVVIGTTDLPTARKAWERLLDPWPVSEPGLWHVGDGPAIRLVEAKEDALQELVVSVVSLQRARAVLQTRQMMDSDSREVIIRSPQLDGIVIRLVQDK